MESEKKTTITTTDINNSKKNVSVDLVVKSEYILSERPSCLAALPKEEGSRPPNTTNNNNGDDRDNNNKNNKSLVLFYILSTFHIRLAQRKRDGVLFKF